MHLVVKGSRTPHCFLLTLLIQGPPRSTAKCTLPARVDIVAVKLCLHSHAAPLRRCKIPTFARCQFRHLLLADPRPAPFGLRAWHIAPGTPESHDRHNQICRSSELLEPGNFD
ncbi:hypothetical protein C7974DRAFT_390610 [Boeremia exigua]|uniref:uncharacterized protein n=1 Tax=Boeremia exigua TaxID=749465 RepID=UPI001E8EECDF|nr:uncharacterized protein C7974DRAFT_390610 [Boeremia exigua]KAH6637965.1 hypothetical protein C7974DRAFT_390610 [Boeremia exigua]